MCVLGVGWKPPPGRPEPEPEAAEAARPAEAAVGRADAVHHVRDPLLQDRRELVCLRLGERPGGDGRLEPGLGGGDERGDQAGGGLAVRRVRDLGECLARLEIGLKVAVADAQIRRCRSEVAATAHIAPEAEATVIARRSRGL